MENTKQILNKEISVNNVNTDTFLKVKFEQSNRLLPFNNINKIVNAAERFNVERQRCKTYRLIGTINATLSNPLFNITGIAPDNKYTWSWFNDIQFLDKSYPKDNDSIDEYDLTFPSVINTSLIEKEGWFGAYEPDITKKSLCNMYDMEPKRDRFFFIPDIKPYNASVNQKPVKNWELTITYPYSSDKTHNMVNGGLLITNHVRAIVSTREMSAIGLSCKHNLTIGDVVRISGTTGYDGEHIVVRTGLDNGDMKDFYFVIDKPFLSINNISNNSRIKKVINDIESEYYFRIFKKVKTINSSEIQNDDYDIYKLGFSENIFSDLITQFVINEDIDITDLVDNLGRPLNELFLTILKTDSNGLFTPIVSGIETPFDSRLTNSDTIVYLRNIPAINRIHNGGSTPFLSHTALENSITINNSTFYGDLIEYNKNTLLETVLADVTHSFNTKNRESTATLTYNTSTGNNIQQRTINLGPRYEGYYYKPHYQYKIRTISNYIEFGDEYTEGMPTYATDLGDGRFSWRELLDIGLKDSNEQILDYPFLNNAHYLYQNFSFTLKRQDAFGKWGLYYSKFPQDPAGDRITDKYTVNSQEDVC